MCGLPDCDMPMMFRYADGRARCADHALARSEVLTLDEFVDFGHAERQVEDDWRGAAA